MESKCRCLYLEGGGGGILVKWRRLPTRVGRGQKLWKFADVLNGWSHRTTLIETVLWTCNLWTSWSVSCKAVNFLICKWQKNSYFQMDILCHLDFCHNRKNGLSITSCKKRQNLRALFSLKKSVGYKYIHCTANILHICTEEFETKWIEYLLYILYMYSIKTCAPCTYGNMGYEIFEEGI